MLYSLRREHPLRPALSAIFEAEDGRFQAILAGVRDAARSAGPGLLALWLFGSVARGDDRERSDLDLALVAEPGSLPRLADAFRDQVTAMGETAGFSPAVVALGTDDVVRLSAERDPWWRRVAHDAVALIGEHPEALAARLIQTSPPASPRAAAELAAGRPGRARRGAPMLHSEKGV